nr:MAG: RNA-dependent RNA polymerase [Guiyang Paspalum thunbergii narna-like virus 1]
MVFYHASIPLTVNKRGVNASKRSGGAEQFIELLRSLSNSLNGNPDSNEFLTGAWDYDYVNIWEDRVKGLFLHQMDQKQAVEYLNTNTYWFKRLRPNTRRMLIPLLATKQGRLHLKEILHTVDGIMIAVIIAFPEVILVPEPDKAYLITDRITNNIISSCLFNYGQTLKKWKSFKKDFKKCAFLDTKMDFSDFRFRSMSWVVNVIKFYNNNLQGTNSKAKMFRVCAFTQTRATGLADKKMVRDTIDEFIKTVTVKQEFNPSNVLQESIDEVVSFVTTNVNSVSPHFRVSMSTSACAESSKKKEGKFGFLKESFKKGELPPIEKFSPDNPGGQLGTRMFEEARRRIKSSDNEIFKVNVTCIRENGKGRVVTSGSIHKDAALQPFSHLTIETVKCHPTLRDSLSSGRLCWEFISKISHLDSFRGELLFEDEVYVMSFDFEKATDRPSHESAHAVMRPFLEKMGTPPDLVEEILSIWPGRKDMYLNGEYVGQMVNGIPMGDPLTKTNLSLVHPICETYANKMVGKRVIGCGVGNGDDGVQIRCGPHAKEWFDHFLAGAKQLGYDLSEKDYFITRDWFTYCEEIAMIPIDRFHTVPNAVRLRDDRLLPYLDVPKLRLAIDTKKDRRDFSSDTKGKYTLMSKDLEYACRGGVKGMGLPFEVASICQDIALGLNREKVPVYIPRQIYSVGKTPGFMNPESWTNAIFSQRTWCVQVTYQVLREMIDETPRLLTNYRGVITTSTHFDNESLVEVKTIPSDDPIRERVVVRKEEFEKFPPGVLERLREAGRLVPERKIQAYYLFQKRIDDLQQIQTDSDLFEIIKQMSVGLQTPSKQDLMGVCDRFRRKFWDRPWTMETSIAEDLYPQEVITWLERSNPLRVDLPEFKFLDKFSKPLPADTPKGRDINRLEAWFWDNVENILSGEDFDLPPTGIIEDDPIMIMAASRSEAALVIFVTNDRALVRLGRNKVPSKVMGHISIEDWVNLDADEMAIIEPLKERFPGLTIEVIVDQGSLETFLMKTDISPTKYPGWTESFSRSKVRSQADIYDVYLPPKILNTDTVFDVVNIEKWDRLRLRNSDAV